MEDIITSLREFDALRDTDNHQNKDTVLPGVLSRNPPIFDNYESFENINPILLEGLEKMGISRLYEHQSRAISVATKGEDVVLEAPTASGKTLSFLVPLFNSLLDDENTHGLMIYPMKAIANDQKRQIDEFREILEVPNIRPRIYDGDTDPEDRHLMRMHPPAIILTNPEMLHYSFLGWANQWKGFLENIRFIVIQTSQIHS